MITPIDIYNARKRIKGHIIETPLERSHGLSQEIGTNVFLKLENFQVSGSFKSRGGFNKILKTWECLPTASFVAPTAGGHGVGLSYAASILNATAHILMPKDADPDRIKDIENNGASIRLCESVTDARTKARQLEKEERHVFVSAYNDVEMIEGAGTIGLELMEQLPQIDCLVCGVGGGGYLAGIGIVAKTLNPDIKIFGVQQANAPFLATWHKTQKYPSQMKTKPSIAEGIGAEIEENSMTWDYVNKFTEDFLIVSETEISNSVKWVMEEHKHYVEPSAVVGVTAIRKNREFFSQFKNVATIITGRNMSFSRFQEILSIQD